MRMGLKIGATSTGEADVEVNSEISLTSNVSIKEIIKGCEVNENIGRGRKREQEPEGWISTWKWVDSP